MRGLRDRLGLDDYREADPGRSTVCRGNRRTSDRLVRPSRYLVELMEGAQQEHLTLRDYAAPVVARISLVVAIVVLITGGAYYYYSQKDQVYKASTKLYVAQEADPLVGLGAGFSDDRTVE